jgi:hypothetical protein
MVLTIADRFYLGRHNFCKNKLLNKYTLKNILPKIAGARLLLKALKSFTELNYGVNGPIL